MKMITTANNSHVDVLIPMAHDLWPDENPQELREVFLTVLNQPEKYGVLIYTMHEEVLGFIYLSVRVDYVEGSTTSPVGYVEGIYVKPHYRRQGISGSLLKAGEQWARDKGCSEIGSDILADNTVSYEFHKAIGFCEAERLITFIKKID